MARTQTIVQLTDELLTLLDQEASRRGISRSALIREILDEHLAAQRSVGAQIADGYRRIPPATPDDWAELDALTDLSALETLRRLDTEEREAGHGRW